MGLLLRIVAAKIVIRLLTVIETLISVLHLLGVKLVVVVCAHGGARLVGIGTVMSGVSGEQ